MITKNNNNNNKKNNKKNKKNKNNSHDTTIYLYDGSASQVGYFPPFHHLKK
jgi:hypothetical protein